MTWLAVLLVTAAALVVLLVQARRAVARVRTLEGALASARMASDDAAQAQRRLQAALAALPQGIVLFDATGAPVLSNEAVVELGASRPGEALLDDAVADLARETAAAPAHATGRRSMELFGPPRRVLELHAVRLREDGAPAEVLVVIDDITDRRRLEAVRRDFVANISHELKTPVGALSLLAETLLAEDDAAVARRLAERMLTEAERVGRTIDDLLALSSIEAGEAGLRDEVPVHVAVAEAVERVRPAADHRGIDLEVAEPSPRLTVLGDRRQLVSAIYNLLDNAVKYSDPGSPVQVRAGTDGRWVDVAVTDRGIGIPRRDLERVFERFYRVDRARSRETGGTGLGLAIVRHVASNHAGEVRVESQEGEGSTFTLRLPVGPGPVAVSAEAG